MIFKLFSRAFERKKNKGLDLSVEDLLRYPPVTFGIPACDSKNLLTFYDLEIRKLLPASRIKRSGNSENEDEVTFESLYLQAIQNLAKYVHLLPASEYHHHQEVGGLFYHSLQTAHGCLEYARQKEGGIPKTKQGMAVDVNNLMKPRWVYGAWLLGLMHDIGKVIVDIKVSAADKEVPDWHPLTEDILQWANKHSVDRYFTTWDKNRVHKHHEDVAALLYMKIVPPIGQRYLSFAGEALTSQIFTFLTGKIDNNLFLHQITNEVDGLVTKKDLSTRWDQNLGDIRINIEKTFIVTLREVAKKLKVNTADGQIFYVGGCVFLRIDVLDRVIGKAKTIGYENLPKETKVLANILEERGITERVSDNSWYGSLQPEIENVSKHLPVVKLSSPIILYEAGNLPPPVAGIYKLGQSNKEVHFDKYGTIRVSDDLSTKETITDAKKTSTEEVTEEENKLSTKDSEKEHQNNGDSSSEDNTPETKEKPAKNAGKSSPTTKSKNTGKKGASTKDKQGSDEKKITTPKINFKNDTSEADISPTQQEVADKAPTSPNIVFKNEVDTTCQNKTSSGQKSTSTKDSGSKKSTSTKDSASKKSASTKDNTGKNGQMESSSLPVNKKRSHQQNNKAYKKLDPLISSLKGEITLLIENCDVLYRDGHILLSENAIQTHNELTMIDAVTNFKQLNIIEEGRAFRSIDINSESRAFISLNQGASEYVITNLNISTGTIDLVQTSENTVKVEGKKEEKGTEIKFSGAKEAYKNEILKLASNSPHIQSRTDGVWVLVNKITIIQAKVSPDLKHIFTHHVEKYEEIEIDEKKYINVMSGEFYESV